MKSDRMSDLNRRQFLKGGSFATMMMMMGGIPLNAAEAAADGATSYTGEATPVNVGVIGCGPWARELLKTLSTLPSGPVMAVCDTYPAMLRRAATLAPNAQKYEDYKQLLADKNVQAVVVATPTHLHKDIVIEALKAGKHVYCEAPMASSIEDARAIAKAAREAFQLNFQVGLQSRADRQIYYLANFIRSGVLGKPLKARQQFHKKQSWRLPSPNPERESEINWRLDRALSLGLVGELGVHQIDIGSWYLNAQPLSATGFGSLVQWKDGRDVPDNVFVVLEYPGGVFLQFEATIGNSFESELSLFYGTDCAVMMRDRRAWMFKEADAPLLGWEVYARKDAFYNESGIALGAGNTKQEAQKTKDDEPAEVVVDEKSPLQYALGAFLKNSDTLGSGVADFKENFDPGDTAALKEYVQELQNEKSWLPAATWRDGLDSTVTVATANQAILKAERVVFKPEWYELA